MQLRRLKLLKRKMLWAVCFLYCFVVGSTDVYGQQGAMENHWAIHFAENLQQEDILKGALCPSDLSTDAFEEEIHREEFFALVSACAGLSSERGELPFADKGEVDSAFYTSLLAAHRAGILEGEEINGNRYCFPKKEITRQEACAVISRAFDISYYDRTFFADDSDIAKWSVAGVSALSRSGAVSGYLDNTFRPNEYLKRGEAYAIVWEVYEKQNREIKQISIFAGNGQKGFQNGEVKEASFGSPVQIAVDGKDGLYIAESMNNDIRKIYQNKVETIAGRTDILNNMGYPVGGYLDTSAKSALFHTPSGILVTEQGVLISDRENHSLRLLAGENVITLAGGLGEGFLDGDHKKAQFSLPGGLAEGQNKAIYVADTGNNAVRMVDTQGKVATIAGGTQGYQDGNCSEALFCEPEGLKFQGEKLYVADTGNHAIRMIENGTVTTIAGAKNAQDANGVAIGDYKDGNAQDALFSFPMDIAVGEDGTIYVADTGNGMIRVVRDGKVSTLVGLFHNGQYLERPSGLCLMDDTLYVADAFKNQIFTIYVGKE